MKTGNDKGLLFLLKKNKQFVCFDGDIKYLKVYYRHGLKIGRVRTVSVMSQPIFTLFSHPANFCMQIHSQGRLYQIRLSDPNLQSISCTQSKITQFWQFDRLNFIFLNGQSKGIWGRKGMRFREGDQGIKIFKQTCFTNDLLFYF